MKGIAGDDNDDDVCVQFWLFCNNGISVCFGCENLQDDTKKGDYVVKR